MNHQIGRHTVLVSLCKLEIENHKRVSRLLMRAMLDLSIEAHVRREAVEEVHYRRVQVARLRLDMEHARDRATLLKGRLACR